MIYQQTDYQGFHIGTNAEPAAGAIDTAAPDYDPATHRARWVGDAWDVRTKEAWDLILNPPPPVLTAAEVLQAKREAAVLTRREFFHALDAAGFYNAVMALKDDPATPRAVVIDLQEAQTFERLFPTLLAAAEQLQVTDAQLDAVFGIA